MYKSTNTGLEYFWGGVGLGTAVRLTQLARCRLADETKVANFDVVASVDQEVLELEISMSDVEIMHITHGRRDLGGPQSGPILADGTC